MNVISILEELENTSGRLDKEAILEKNRRNELLQACLYAGLDQTVPHNVSKVKVAPAHVSHWKNCDEALTDFIGRVLPQISSKAVTGNAAKALVKSALSEMNSAEQKWAQRILLKRLRIGVQESTVNRVWPNLIRTFEVQLAHSLKTEYRDGVGVVILEDVKFPVRLEPKLDGLRLIVMKREGTVTMFTRNGTELNTLPKLAEIIERSDGDDYVLDGEIMGADWNESASVAMSRVNLKDESTLRYNVFDMVPISEWDAQESTEPYSVRIENVTNQLALISHERVVQVEGTVVRSIKELWGEFKRCTGLGYEGVMLKDVGETYQFKRTKALRKLKPIMTFEGVIVEIKGGRIGSKREGGFGGFKVLFPTGETTDVGSGFTDRMLAEIQIDPEKWIGRVIEVEGQPDPTTVDGYSKDGKVRFPVYIRERSWDDVDRKLETVLKEWNER